MEKIIEWMVVGSIFAILTYAITIDTAYHSFKDISIKHNAAHYSQCGTIVWNDNNESLPSFKKE